MAWRQILRFGVRAFETAKRRRLFERAAFFQTIPQPRNLTLKSLAITATRRAHDALYDREVFHKPIFR
ncbi:hypothetical protein [Sphingobium cloacae]|uniref:hypothetical protein n=1 Tax=Sphingobium cloacae TaxID=120107 RepID=UPI0018D4E7D0|nr:hypothetical protein [Sphingobium cloacae]